MKRELYQARKENRICVDCGALNDRVNRVRCSECSRKDVERHMQARIFYKSLGICPVCNKNRLFGDEKSCPECRAKNTNYKLTHRSMDYNKNHAEWSRNTYQARKEKGICVRCGKKKAEKGLRCMLCIDKAAKLRKNKETPKIPRQDRYRYGLCAFCNNPIEKGYKVCEYHHKMNIEKSKKVDRNNIKKIDKD